MKLSKLLVPTAFLISSVSFSQDFLGLKIFPDSVCQLYYDTSKSIIAPGQQIALISETGVVDFVLSSYSEEIDSMKFELMDIEFVIGKVNKVLNYECETCSCVRAERVGIKLPEEYRSYSFAEIVLADTVEVQPFLMKLVKKEDYNVMGGITFMNGQHFTFESALSESEFDLYRIYVTCNCSMDSRSYVFVVHNGDIVNSFQNF
jgi:hypothetical protein